MGTKRKFSEDQMKDIRCKYEAGATLEDLATEYGITRPTVRTYITLVGGQIRKIGPDKGTTGRIHRPKNIEQLQEQILKLLPNATFSKDHTGQLVIHTGLKTMMVEVFVPMDE